VAAGIAQNAVPAHYVSKSAKTQAAGITNSIVDLDLTIPRGDVIATLNFYKALEDGSITFFSVEAPPEGQPQQKYGTIATESTIYDIRGHIDMFNLEKTHFR
jgi:hypothetical protein